MVSHINKGEGIPQPTLVECYQIPDEREEISTPEAAYHHPHLRHLVKEIPAMDMNAEILILLRRDILRVHKVRKQCNGPDDAPYAQKLDLGWVIVGDVCLDTMCMSPEIHSFKTYMLGNGRASHFKQCPHHYEVKEKPLDIIQVSDVTPNLCDDNLGTTVFCTTSNDNKIVLSVEDREFIKIMDIPPVQRSLGLRWDLLKDTFGFRVSSADKPFTKCSVLSVVNSLYDPVGFVAPITIQGKSLLRQFSETIKDWDAPLQIDQLSKWESWKQSLHALDGIHVPSCYTSALLATSQRKELRIFSDASTEAIAAVAYLKVRVSSNQAHIGFLFGKAKLAPKPDHTIPRLELCGTVLAVEIADFILRELDIQIDDVRFYTDSKVVLGYIYNQTKHYYVYVSNRVERIRKSSKPEQWHYVPSEINPAAHATRPVSASVFANPSWLTGPEFLLDHPEETTADVFSLLEPDKDPEIHS
ncbi:uncharacterized protein [Aquarana catesbeiana]|uniref:uncharacterized protein isoform X1 n=1 Tax=Aquarana catesbeiana TaxID=8400 RepID=UPI003CC928BF